MILRDSVRIYCKNCVRQYCKKLKPKIIPDENVILNISKDVFKPKKHPGIMLSKTVALPDAFLRAVHSVLEDRPPKTLLADSQKLINHLKARMPPVEPEEIQETNYKVHERLLSKYKDLVIKDEKDAVKFKQMIKDKKDKILREKIYNWKPIKYGLYNSLLYMMGRAAPEYSVLVKIFGEIAARDPNFKPRSFFDFGSGVGTGSWAANVYWKKNIFEYFNVDASRDMNDLAQTLLQGGKGTGIVPKGVFYRQFLPATNSQYDLVLCAYSLMELPSLETRLETILNLWNKTQNYLVVVEMGSNAGFKVVNEVRDFILHIKQKSNEGHVFSPCPHDDVCPRFLLDDGTPCNFEVNYFSLPTGRHSESRSELYSYVILKKGGRDFEELKWPRIVRETLVRSKHTICRVCTAEGKLDELIFTAAKHGKTTYHCARASQWGDLLPVTVESIENTSTGDKKEIENNNISDQH